MFGVECPRQCDAIVHGSRSGEAIAAEAGSSSLTATLFANLTPAIVARNCALCTVQSKGVH